MKWPLCRLKVNIICQWTGAGVQCLQCISYKRHCSPALSHGLNLYHTNVFFVLLYTIIIIIISFLVFSILFIYIYIYFFLSIFIFLIFLIIIYWILYLLIVIIILSLFPNLNYNNYFNYFHITFSPHSLIFFPSLIVITHVNVYECPTSWNLYVVYVLQGDQLDKPCFSGILK